jgi:mono/diheme cytochrome c family protein
VRKIMQKRPGILLVLVSVFVLSSTSHAAEPRPMMKPIVPPNELQAAEALKSPFPQSTVVIEKGKAIYEGKGACFNCHGMSGRGDGPASVGLDPSPRNFHHPALWRHRTEGEIFWVIKNGSVGTSMIGFGAQLSDEEIWTVMQYIRTFADNERGPGMHRRGDMGRGGRRGSQEGRGPHGRMGAMGPGEGACCP